jgi:hypothetical protein
MLIQPKISFAILLLSAIVYPVSSRAEGDFADKIISGLKSFDSNVSAIQEKGFGGWLSDHVSDKAWEHIPDLFGDMSDTVKNVQTAGKDDYRLLSGGTNAFSTGYSSFGSSDAAEQEAQQNQIRFWDSLPDEQRALAKDGLQMSMPEPLKKLADKIETFYSNSQWVADKLEALPSAIDDSVASTTSRVQGYVADVKNLGLEPGSANYQAAATATTNGNPAFASEVEAPVSNSDEAAENAPPHAASATSTDDSPSPRHAGKSSNAQDNDLVADLRSAGWDSSSTSKDPSAISSDDLAALGGGSVNATTASKIDTDQLQADLSDWDRQQAEAREKEKARLAAIARQRQAEADARQLQRARDYAARQQALAEQAEQDAELAAQQPARTTPAPADGMSVFDAVTMGIQSWQALDAARHRGAGWGSSSSGPDAWFNGTNNRSGTSGNSSSSRSSSSGPSCNGDAPGVNNNPNGVDCSVKTGASK